jgi:hypothetical protein
MISKELDIVTLLKSIRKVKLMSQVVLTQQQNTLLKFQQRNVIDTNSSSSDSDDNDQEPFKLLENKDPMVRLILLGKIKRVFKSY